MYRVLFKSTGQVHEFSGKKEIAYWKKIATLHGLGFTQYKSGSDVFLTIYDEADPLFRNGKGK